MRAIRALLMRLVGLGRKRASEADLQAELAAHVSMHVEDAVRAGRDQAEARRTALTHLGGSDQTREQVRDRSGVPALEGLLQDTRYALRLLRRSPGITLAAVGTLALGIGGTTAIFSVVDATLLRPLPYPEPHRLVAIQETNPIGVPMPTNAMHFREWRDNVRAFEGLTLVRQMDLNLTNAGEPELVSAARVSASFFDVLGVRPVVGRPFAEAEDQVGRDRVVVINDALWRRRWNGDPSILGKHITLDGIPYEVIGVMPPSFRFPRLSTLYALGISGAEPQIWKPFAAAPAELTVFGFFNFASIGRLRHGVTREQALAEVAAIQQRIGTQIPGGFRLGAAMPLLQEQIVHRSRPALVLILMAVAMVLLIACVNVASLLVMRSSTRSREVAVRMAVGASRLRLIRQLLVESVVLAGIGCLLGVTLAYGVLPALLVYAPEELPRLHAATLDVRVLMFAAGLSLLVGLATGLLPALRFSARQIGSAMTVRAPASRASGRLRASLVAVEVAATCLCLVVCGLLVNSFVRLLRVDPGFAVERVLNFELRLPVERYPGVGGRARLIQSLNESLESLPGVVAAGAASITPMTGTGAISGIALEGATTPPSRRPTADMRQATAGYFRASGIPLRSGRLFTDADRQRSVVVVSTQAADTLWPGLPAIGKRFRVGDAGPMFEVIGTVGDIRTQGLDQPAVPIVYVSAAGGYFGTRVAFHVRTAANAAPLATRVTQVIRTLDNEFAIPVVRTMDDVIAASVAPRRFQLTLVAVFGVLALFLACIGIYGVVSQAVVQRTGEFGVRLALGARAGQIRALVLRQGALPVAIGLFTGIALAQASGQFISSLLYEVEVTDALTISVVGGVLALVSLAAMYLPAIRASRVDPMVALRAE